MPGGGDALAIAARRSSMSLVIPASFPKLTSDSACSCAACPGTVADGADTPRVCTLTTVGTLLRSVASVVSHAWSAGVKVLLGVAATTGTGIRFVVPNGAARLAACWLGALAGRKSALFPCVTLASEGSARGMITAAATQTISTTQRNLTANEPIARKMSSACTRPTIARDDGAGGDRTAGRNPVALAAHAGAVAAR